MIENNVSEFLVFREDDAIVDIDDDDGEWFMVIEYTFIRLRLAQPDALQVFGEATMPVSR